MLPLFAYCLVQSKLPCVHAELAFMNHFVSNEDKQMKRGFYLTTLEAAAAALLENKLPQRNSQTI